MTLKGGGVPFELNDRYKAMHEIVYEEVRKQILEMRRHPGEKLIQDQLATELGVSRMPVRDALHRLASEGLITFIPHRGARVSRLSAREADELYEIRENLEPVAGYHAAHNMTELELQELERIVQQMRELVNSDKKDSAWAHGLTVLNREFHTRVYRASRHKWLIQFLDKIWDSIQQYRTFYGMLPEPAGEMHQEHMELFQLLTDGDANAFAERLRRHISRARSMLVNHIQRVVASDGT